MSYVAFPFLADSAYTKPDKTNKERYPDGLKEQYHLDFAKWALFNAHEWRHTEWLHNTYRNKRYYMGKQWENPEDIQSFLMDDSGQTRGRIKIAVNQIRPMVEQYRGNAIRLAIGASVKSISKKAKVRKETALKRLLLIQDISKEFESLGEAIQNNNPEIGQTEQETEMIFENTYVDKYVEVMNRLLQWVAEYNDMEEMQSKIAENMAYSGLGTIEEYKHGAHLRKEVVEPEEFFWDRNARRRDLQDAAYQGRIHMMSVPDIYERWQGLSTDDRAAIEAYVTTDSNTTNQYQGKSQQTIGNSVPVYKTFFMDDIKKTFGYVEDEFGQPYGVYINEADQFKEGKVWKEEDLIDPPETNENKKLFKGKKKRAVVVSTLRYCIFIPGEAINYRRKGEKGMGNYPDVVMEYGQYDYQETDWLDLSRNRYPFKSYAWAYVDGQVLSPIDDVIDPQRFMNRIMSAIEAQVNQSGGSNMVYDLDMLDDDDGEFEIMQNAKLGKPIKIRTRGKGVPNTVGFYDNTIKGGTYQMFSLLPTLKDMMNGITGVNEGLRGESTGSDQLVGVTQLLIQRGSLMQEPFYDAIARVFLQSHQATVTVGKKIYIDNQKELVEIAGDESIKILQLSEEMELEEFRAFVKRTNSREQQIQQGDQVLFILLERQLIDDKFFADHFGRSTVEQITIELRKLVNKRILAAQRAEQEQAAAAEVAQAQEAQAAQAAVQAAKEQDLEDKSFQAAESQDKKQHELNKIAMKGAVDSALKAQDTETQIQQPVQ
jgi:hypothetical protein